MQSLILAAGFGTRLYPLTQDTPKALIKINEKPAIEYIIERIPKEVEKIYIVANNKHYINFLEWLEGYKAKTDKKIKIINNGINNEKEIKGTPLEIKNFLEKVETDDMLVLACDNIFTFNLNELITIGQEKQASIIALREENKELIKIYSSVILDENNRMIEFIEKPENPKSNIAATFCFFLKKQDLEIIKKKRDEELRKFRNVLEFLYKESSIYGKVFDDFWCDIGTLDNLREVEKFIK